MKLRFLALIVLGVIGISCSDKKQAQESPEPTQELELSRQIVAEFPLMPHIEKHFWQKLIAAELDNNTEEAEKIAATLRERHPFSSDDTKINLGGIVYHKETKRIEIPARVNYPVAGDDRHPGELELILCSEKGRTHETLFITECRPLHLELILHLAGYKSESGFRVQVSIPDHPAIPVENLILLENKTHPESLIWEFSSNPFQPLYQPDQTGDFIICWHAHESVLIVNNQGIADGVTKLQYEKHPKLEQGVEVKLVLIYQDEIDN